MPGPRGGRPQIIRGRTLANKRECRLLFDAVHRGGGRWINLFSSLTRKIGKRPEECEEKTAAPRTPVISMGMGIGTRFFHLALGKKERRGRSRYHRLTSPLGGGWFAIAGGKMEPTKARGPFPGNPRKRKEIEERIPAIGEAKEGKPCCRPSKRGGGARLPEFAACVGS